MFAIVKTGGQQYKVAKDDKIQIDKLDAEEGKKVTLNNVLFLKNAKGEAIFGEPEVKGASVEAEVLRNFKGKKVIIFKKRRRQNSRRKTGFRADKTELKILNINESAKAATSAKKETAKAENKAPAAATTAKKKPAAKKTTTKTTKK